MAGSNVVYETKRNDPMTIMNNESDQTATIKNNNPPLIDSKKETSIINFVQLLSNLRNVH